MLNEFYTLFQLHHSKLTKSQTKVNGPKLQVIEYTKPYKPDADESGALYYLRIILFTTKKLANQRSLGEIEPQGAFGQLKEFSPLRTQIEDVKELARHLDNLILKSYPWCYRFAMNYFTMISELSTSGPEGGDSVKHLNAARFHLDVIDSEDRLSEDDQHFK